MALLCFSIATLQTDIHRNIIGGEPPSCTHSEIAYDTPCPQHQHAEEDCTGEYNKVTHLVGNARDNYYKNEMICMANNCQTGTLNGSSNCTTTYP